MIYKIINDFEILSRNMSEIFKISNIFLYNDCLYISDIYNQDNTQDIIKDLFNGSQIYTINENNLIYEAQTVIEWAKQEFIKADLIQYEKDNQEKLQNAMKILDSVEKELFEGRECQWQTKNEKEVDPLKKLIKSIRMKGKNKSI